MGWRVIGAFVIAIVLAGAPWACTLKEAPLSVFNENTDPDSNVPDEYVPGFSESGEGEQCHGFACKKVACPPGTKTSISGTIYDPAGSAPLYDVAVYVPSSPLSDIPSGIDLKTCNSCAAPLSGDPVAVTLTDSPGHFKLDDVPAG